MSVVVDELSMATPVDVVDGYGVGPGSQGSIWARHIADSRCWPSWDYGPRPV